MGRIKLYYIMNGLDKLKKDEIGEEKLEYYDLRVPKYKDTSMVQNGLHKGKFCGTCWYFEDDLIMGPSCIMYGQYVGEWSIACTEWSPETYSI